MKQGVVFLALLFASSAGLACTAAEAFGFKLGEPVPRQASKEQRDGGHVKNAMGYFDGEVPKPLEGFQHGYGANKDRAFVYGIDAKRVMIPPGTPDPDKAFKAIREQMKAEILSLKDALAKEYNLTFEQDYESGLSWTARNGDLMVTVHSFSGALRVECLNTELMGKAMKAAMKSW
jgi:hypothetical protein